MIVFSNPGLIPLDAIRLMGASVKTEGAFGRFGTGLKYAIATILRGGGSIKVRRGPDEYGFAVRTVMIKDTAFGEVVLTYAQETGPDEPGVGVLKQDALGFTTDLGKDWEPWMALRELACNARDEGGDWAVIDRDDALGWKPDEDETVILVEWDAMEEAATGDKEHVFAPSTEVLLEEAGVRVLPGPSDYLYHRGVRVWKLPKPSVFTYDVTKRVELTEDRNVKYGFCVVADVRNMILKTEDRSIIAATVTAKKGTWERTFDWSGSEWGAVEPGFTWVDEIAALREARNDYGGNLHELSQSARDVWIKQRAFKEVQHSSSWSSFEGETHGLNVASRALEDLGFNLDDEEAPPIYITRELPGGAMSALNGGRIYLTEDLLNRRSPIIFREMLMRLLEMKGGSDYDTLLGFAVDHLFKFGVDRDRYMRGEWSLEEEENKARDEDPDDITEAPEPDVDEVLF